MKTNTPVKKEPEILPLPDIPSTPTITPEINPKPEKNDPYHPSPEIVPHPKTENKHPDSATGVRSAKRKD